MITFDQLSALIKAGYTQEQITTINSIMSQPQNATAPATAAPNPSPTPSPTPTPNNPLSFPAPATVPAPVPVPAAPQDADSGTAPKTDTVVDGGKNNESETLGLLKEMLGLMQKGNINGISTQELPKPADGAQILAEILNPQPEQQK